MKYIYVTGGDGAGLWPLSTSVRPKQFIKLYENDVGELDSSVQNLWKQLKKLQLEQEVVFVADWHHSELLKKDCGENIKIVKEPLHKSTFAAVCLAALYLKEVELCQEDEWIAILPDDFIMDEDFFQAIQKLPENMMYYNAQLGLLGFKPTSPNPQSSYIDISPYDTKGPVFPIHQLIENPSTESAKELIARGALWNSGAYVLQLNTVLQVLRSYSLPLHYEQFVAQYETLDTAISFESVVLDCVERSIVYEHVGAWQYIGSWDGVAQQLTTEKIGIGVMKGQSDNSHIVNELLLPIHVVDVDNIIVAASYEGILITNKKPIYDSVTPSLSQKQLENYRVLTQFNSREGNDVLVKQIQLSEGEVFSYESYDNRCDCWTILEGEGELVLEDVVLRVQAGDVIHIEIGKYYALKAYTNMQLMEVQIGCSLGGEEVDRISVDNSLIGWKSPN